MWGSSTSRSAAAAAVVCLCVSSLSGCLRDIYEELDLLDDDDDDPDISEGEGEEGEGEPDPDIVVALEAEGFVVTFADGSTIETEIEQLVDKDDPSQGTFFQRVQFLHQDRLSPMLVVSTGYGLFGNVAEEIAQLWSTNQVLIEHRYFDFSRPSSSDWSALTIENAAHDHHVIIEKLRRIYSGNFVSTGHSKGGMTSLYHRRFYPDDVDGVVAYVAPASFGLPDERYDTHLEQVGLEPCRSSLRAVTAAGALHVEEIAEALVDEQGLSFEDAASYTASLIGSWEWGYWQFVSFFSSDPANDCGFAPPVDAEETRFFFNIDPSTINDAYLAFEPYEYQVRAQLGEPNQVMPHLRAVLGPFNPDWRAAVTVSSFTNTPVYDEALAMQDVVEALADDDGILYLYGGVDPWTGGAYPEPAIADRYFLVDGADHAVSLLQLEPARLDVAGEVITGFLGLPPGFVNFGFAARPLLPTHGEVQAEAEMRRFFRR